MLSLSELWGCYGWAGTAMVWLEVLGGAGDGGGGTGGRIRQ